MRKYENGEWWDYRNHQRIGVAVAEMKKLESDFFVSPKGSDAPGLQKIQRALY
jgi:hypothetical protein